MANYTKCLIIRESLKVLSYELSMTPIPSHNNHKPWTIHNLTTCHIKPPINDTSTVPPFDKLSKSACYDRINGSLYFRIARCIVIWNCTLTSATRRVGTINKDWSFPFVNDSRTTTTVCLPPRLAPLTKHSAKRNRSISPFLTFPPSMYINILLFHPWLGTTIVSDTFPDDKHPRDTIPARCPNMNCPMSFSCQLFVCSIGSN